MMIECLESRVMLAASAFLYKDFLSLPAYVSSNKETSLVEAGGKSYHIEDKELWVHNASTSTKIFEEIGSNSRQPTLLEFVGDTQSNIIFRSQDDLYTSDGTAGGTVKLQSDVRDMVFADLGDGVAYYERRGSEIFITDGTPDGTLGLSSLSFGSGVAAPQPFFDRLIFRTFASPEILGITDGTKEGTVFIRAAERLNTVVYNPLTEEIYVATDNEYLKLSDNTSVSPSLFHLLENADSFKEVGVSVIVITGDKVHRLTESGSELLTSIPRLAYDSKITSDSLYYLLGSVDNGIGHAGKLLKGRQIRSIDLITGEDTLVHENNTPIEGLEFWNKTVLFHNRDDEGATQIFALADVGTSPSMIHQSTYLQSYDPNFSANSDGTLYFRSASQWGDEIWRFDGDVSSFVYRRHQENTSFSPSEIKITDEGITYVLGTHLRIAHRPFRFVPSRSSSEIVAWSDDGFITISPQSGFSELSRFQFDVQATSNVPIYFRGPIRDLIQSESLIVFSDSNRNVWALNFATQQVQLLGNRTEVFEFTAAAGQVFYSKKNEQQVELWRSDATQSGTQQIFQAEESVFPLADFGERVAFTKQVDRHLVEVWVTDGTRDATKKSIELHDEEYRHFSGRRYQDSYLIQNGTGTGYLVSISGELKATFGTDVPLASFVVLEKDWLFVKFRNDDGAWAYWPIANEVIDKSIAYTFSTANAVASNGALFLQDGTELWKLPRHSTKAQVIGRLESDDEPNLDRQELINVIDDIAFFSGQDPTRGNELWALDIQPTTIPGDANRDGLTNFADFLILSANFSQVGKQLLNRDGDFDGDGRIGFSDFLILSANFTQQQPASQAAVLFT